ncbi:A disintegrin and metalloproteinase with thrombospondin motifs 1-like [Leptopilina heterotoma]|uniref:A disintegrin and metalloproteinase with thrombospondin motifs 1-like n=1 Tax=Leptopilina heterotoma TaxID=63436 RepID=UPI001CA92DA0|nr:A disintegrin and metalloproteinase with thrombospondin motifs 1-like [Leptopilina heterotoma]XP_043473639.1 A disintegrin and metalloproteinase with thrombospondin motifs 1-like [Leptopilina heterotoma]
MVGYGDNGQIQMGLAGLAYPGRVCQNNNNYYSCGVFEDRNGYGGINVAAHELGHILGADDETENYKPGYTPYDPYKCYNEHGYIMSYNRQNKNKILFSPCSKSEIKATLSQYSAQCIRNNPADYENNKPLPRILPGQLMSLDQQCRNLGYAQCYQESTTCLDLHCLRTDQLIYPLQNPPAEGSPCGHGKYCLSGKCVNIYKRPVVPKTPNNPITTGRPESNPPVDVQSPTATTAPPTQNIPVVINYPVQVVQGPRTWDCTQYGCVERVQKVHTVYHYPYLNYQLLYSGK